MSAFERILKQPLVSYRILSDPLLCVRAPEDSPLKGAAAPAYVFTVLRRRTEHLSRNTERKCAEGYNK